MDLATSLRNGDGDDVAYQVVTMVAWLWEHGDVISFECCGDVVDGARGVWVVKTLLLHQDRWVPF